MFLRKDIFLLPSLAAVAVIGSSLAAHAQTVAPVDHQQSKDGSANVVSSKENADLSAEQQVSQESGVQQFPNATQYTASRIVTPIPGTVATTSATLTGQSVETPSTPAPATEKIAQSDVDLGRPTRGGRSYIGVAGNIGISGDDSSLSDGNFAVISKVGVTKAFSIRPSAVFGNSTTILIPVTYDFTLQGADAFSEPLAIAPYLGVGAAIKTGDNSKAAFLVTGGVDVPLNAQFTATAAVNAGFFDKTDVGLLVGVGYNFSGF